MNKPGEVNDKDSDEEDEPVDTGPDPDEVKARMKVIIRLQKKHTKLLLLVSLWLHQESFDD